MARLHSRLLFKLAGNLFVSVYLRGLCICWLNFGHVEEGKDVKVLGIQSLRQLLSRLLYFVFSCLVGLRLGNNFFEDFLSGFLRIFSREPFLLRGVILAAATKLHVHDHLLVKFSHSLIPIKSLVVVA